MKAATALINRRALRHNLQRVRELAPNSRLIAVVKANAYGHGLVGVGTEVQELVDGFGVARLNEALLLRHQGINKPIVLLEGFFEQSDLQLMVEYNIDTVIHCVEQLEMLESAQLAKQIKVWMKLDTGMHRLGVLPQHAESFYQRLQSCQNVDLPINIVSHFCQADAPELPTTAKQIECFQQFVSDKPGEKSIAASAGILLWPEAHYDWVRPGIMMYGASPQEGKSAASFGLLPVMTLKSSLIAVREHSAGQCVGYGETWRSERNTLLGVVAIGYGDGYPRNVPSGTPVLVNGRKVPIIGRISMDMTVVDLGPDSTDKVGDDVILWGNALPVEEIAAQTGIINYELLTKLTSRVAMEYVDE
ncbi:Alanine racemase, biosynthetic [Providencia rustigianii]|uniref:Alanine racemase n=1 Tax=Providencia rustigianii DSM 4541 TaxID=500637 RepID=D1P6V1_9GAMM|nr:MULTISPECIES: alanine racemase [Providencia]EFB70798.1 alanine racemase [Providencia rustigianii DSM 4541]MTC56183.1 alanine racemase [Providencia rustigianii]SPY76437.1 Alanine racemase, biosynthetic [Providencia rustigianii]SUC25646.1 Alanine racemase, biosynthetic [Providencia rustigianii]VEB63591.1 Alanine racemase, biosynthetic [Providencia rustigianii]